MHRCLECYDRRVVPAVELRFEDLSALEKEVADNLRQMRALVETRRELERLAPCALVLIHPKTDDKLRLDAQVVAPLPTGLALELTGDKDEVGARLDEFVALRPRPKSPAERLRGLSLSDQHKVARNGTLTERTILERIYGNSVWESLLSNPKLTIPEVARIARKGTVPRHLLEMVVENKAWVRAAPVRRALLSNPRLGTESLPRILAVTPKPEIQKMLKQTAYPRAVREAAKRFMQGY